MSGTMLRRGVLPTLALVLVLGGVGGCNEDEEGGGTLPVFELRNGTWATTTTWWATGADSCGELPPDMVDTLVACSFDPVDVEDPDLPDNFTCDVTRNGNEVTMSCSGSTSLACTYTLNMEGSGQIGETEVDFTLASVLRATGPEACAGSVSPCTLWVNLTGTWISPEGDSLCSGGSSAPAGLETLATGWQGGLLPREGVSR